MTEWWINNRHKYAREIVVEIRTLYTQLLGLISRQINSRKIETAEDAIVNFYHQKVNSTFNIINENRHLLNHKFFVKSKHLENNTIKIIRSKIFQLKNARKICKTFRENKEIINEMLTKIHQILQAALLKVKKSSKKSYKKPPIFKVFTKKEHKADHELPENSKNDYQMDNEFPNEIEYIVLDLNLKPSYEKCNWKYYRKK